MSTSPAESVPGPIPVRIAPAQEAPRPVAEEGTGGNGRKLPSMLRALGYRNYRLFFSGQSISLIGTWMQSVAMSWLVYRLTGSSLLLGLIGFLGQLPVFLLSPFGGAIADRRDRRGIVIATQSASMLLAALLAGLTLTGFVQVWHLFAIAVCFGLVNTFDIPARQAFVAEMVDKRDLINAIGLNSSMFNGARILGPAVAGLLVASIGEGWCFFSNAVSYLAVIWGLLLMRVDAAERSRGDRSALAGTVEGFQFVRRTRPIRMLLLLIGLVSLVGMPYAVLMPVYAHQILQGGARELGLLMGASGIGALAAALTLAARRDLKGLARTIAFSFAGFGVSLILFSLSHTFWLSAALLLPAGFSMITGTASANSLIQAMAPDRMRGRVMAAYTMMFMGMAPFGSLFAGALAQILGVPLVLAIGGAACIAGAGVFASRLTAFRIEARRMIRERREEENNPAGLDPAGSS